MTVSDPSVPPASSACACAAHRPAASVASADRSTWWSWLPPALACAVCPACLSTYAKVLSAVGMGVWISETQHFLLLLTAVSLSLLVGVWRAIRYRRIRPLLVTIVGCTALVMGHALGENQLFTYGGIALLLASGLWQRFARPHRCSPPRSTTSGQVMAFSKEPQS